MPWPGKSDPIGVASGAARLWTCLCRGSASIFCGPVELIDFVEFCLNYRILKNCVELFDIGDLSKFSNNLQNL